jgi:hypothetical protein
MRKFYLIPLAFLFVLSCLLFNGCAAYQKYKPEEEWYKHRIVSLELHFGFLNNPAWAIREKIKIIAIEKLETKGYEIVGTSEAKPGSIDDPLDFYEYKSDALMIIRPEGRYLDLKDSPAPTATYATHGLSAIYHIFIVQQKENLILYGPPPPWALWWRSGEKKKNPNRQGYYMDYSESEDAFISRVLDNTFRNLPTAK